MLPVVSGMSFLLEQERCFFFKRKVFPILAGNFFHLSRNILFIHAEILFTENSRAFHFVFILLYFLKINHCPLDFWTKKIFKEKIC